MKHTWLVGILAGVLVAGSAATQAQQKPAAPTQEPQKPATATQKPAPAAEKPTPAPQKPAAPAMPAQKGSIPTGETVLGTVTIPRPVTADGKPLPQGQYTVRLTAQAAQPTVAGQIPDLNRWVEFVQGGQVRGREVVSIIPPDEVDDTQPGPDLDPGRAPRSGSRVQMLKGNEYLRLWFSRQGVQYLIHLVPSKA
jgi:hypothetical protein